MEQPATQTGWPSHVWARIVAVTSVFGAVMIFLDRSADCARTLAPACVLTARAVTQLLSWIGMECQRNGATLIQPGGFGYEISFVWGATIGAAGMLLINMVRLVSLFYVGVVAPRFFAAFHTFVWPALTVCLALGFFRVWNRGSALQLTPGMNSASHYV
jgi:hypothetical protein